MVGPQYVRGSLEPPSSKAYTHRALVTSFLTLGTSTIEKPLSCDDTGRTLEAIQALGADISRNGNRVKVARKAIPPSAIPRIDCGESGATLRFLTAVSATFQNETILIAKGSLSGRPILPLVEALKSLGASAKIQQNATSIEVRVRGPLRGGSTSIPGDVSSQFISGLLLAAPLATKDVDLVVRGRLESRPYVEMTLEVMRRHGIKVETLPDGFRIPAPQSYHPASHLVPTDFSSAAFLLAAGVTAGGELTLAEIQASSAEPDSVILEVLPKIGARLERSADHVRVSRSELEGFEFDASDHPDLVPALEVLACQARGVSRIHGVGRLVHKESNRLRSVPEELRKLGGKISTNDDTVVITGRMRLSGGELCSHHDHRVAMACATASLTANGTTMIDEAEVVSKSYPDFYNDLAKLGVSLHVE